LVTPFGFTTTLKDAVAPATKLDPDVCESETKLGVPFCSVADQLSAFAPELVRLIVDDVVPDDTLIVRLEGEVVSRDGTATV
jgi:hypothetical protein